MASRSARLRLSPEDGLDILLPASDFGDVLDRSSWDPAEAIPAPNHDEIAGEGEAMPAELAAAIGRLEYGALRDLIALILIGCGDFAPDDWSGARQAAAEIPRERAAAYVADMPLVSDFLRDGLDSLPRALPLQTH